MPKETSRRGKKSDAHNMDKHTASGGSIRDSGFGSSVFDVDYSDSEEGDRLVIDVVGLDDHRENTQEDRNMEEHSQVSHPVHIVSCEPAQASFPVQEVTPVRSCKPCLASYPVAPVSSCEQAQASHPVHVVAPIPSCEQRKALYPIKIEEFLPEDTNRAHLRFVDDVLSRHLLGNGMQEKMVDWTTEQMNNLSILAGKML